MFAHGQAVTLRNAFMPSGRVYRITASLPSNGASPQYRIRNEAEQFERVAQESDLVAVATGLPDQAEASAEALFR